VSNDDQRALVAAQLEQIGIDPRREAHQIMLSSAPLMKPLRTYWRSLQKTGRLRQTIGIQHIPSSTTGAAVHPVRSRRSAQKL
jgi:hypothetical protein